MLHTLLDDPTFFVSLSFVLFLVLIGRPVLKMILYKLDERSLSIEKRINNAFRAKQDADAYLQETHAQDEQSRERIIAIQTRAQEAASAIKKEGDDKLQELIEREKTLAQEQINRADHQALESAKKEAIHLAIVATQKVLAQEIDATTNDKLVDQALDELEKISVVL